jgi:hypothetical protein
VFSFTYDYCDHIEYLHKMAGAMGVPLDGNTLWFPKKIGDGYIRTEVLSNGLQVLINDCRLNEHFHIHRNASQPFHPAI